MTDPFSAAITALTLVLCAIAAWTSHRATTAARRQWIQSGPHDPQVIAIMMSRVGRSERRRLRAALKRKR